VNRKFAAEFMAMASPVVELAFIAFEKNTHIRALQTKISAKKNTLTIGVTCE